MPEWRVTITFYYATDEDIDEDYLHDAIVDSFDTIDLEFDTEVPLYDEKGDETGETRTVNVNCDNVRDVEVTKVGD